MRWLFLGWNLLWTTMRRTSIEAPAVHSHHCNLITWTQPCLIQWNYEPWHVGPPKMDGSWWRVLTKCGPLEKEMGRHLQYSCLENPMNSMKRQKDRALKDELPRSVDARYTTGEEWRNNSRKNEERVPGKNNTQVWMWLAMEVKSSAIKSNIE